RTRVPVSADAGLRLRRLESRPRTGRHRPEVQFAGWTRAAKGIRTRTSVHLDHAPAGRHRRRRQDVEVQGQLHRHNRIAGFDVRQVDVDLRYSDVEVLRAAFFPVYGRYRAVT